MTTDRHPDNHVPGESTPETPTAPVSPPPHVPAGATHPYGQPAGGWGPTPGYTPPPSGPYATGGYEPSGHHPGGHYPTGPSTTTPS
ncbi:MAG TPA: peptidase S1, partial [Gordonia polyisoprenivorans]|nr:peptidase S1 [Gordonia polyisoprenivorans]